MSTTRMSGHRAARRLKLLGLGAAALIAAAPLSSRPAHADEWWNPMSWNDKAAHHHDHDQYREPGSYAAWRDDHADGYHQWLHWKDNRLDDRIADKRADLQGLERRDAAIDRQEDRDRARLANLRGDGSGHSAVARDLRQSLQGLEVRNAHTDHRIADARSDLGTLRRHDCYIDRQLGYPGCR